MLSNIYADLRHDLNGYYKQCKYTNRKDQNANMA